MEAKEKKSRPGRPSRRPEIVAATEKVLRTRGLVNATTKAIAAEAGCSEGALYVHFKSRSELLLAVLEESLPDMLAPLRALDEAVGKAIPRENLHKALLGVFAFHQRVLPGICALFAEPELLAEYRKSLTAQNRGPQGAIGRLRKYIAAEQKLGRIDRKVDADTAATSLMAGSLFHSFTGYLLGTRDPFEPHCKKLVAEAIRL